MKKAAILPLRMILKLYRIILFVSTVHLLGFLVTLCFSILLLCISYLSILHFSFFPPYVAEYGADVSGFTIPAALETIFATVAAKVLVVNVLSAEKASALLDADGRMTRDEAGEVATNIYKPELPEVVDYTADLVAGLDLLLTVDDTLGVKPNIVLAPGYSQIEAVMARMLAVADKLDGFAVIDMAAGDVQEALTARSSGVYNITSQAAVLCYPQVLRYNAHEAMVDTIGLSVHWAAAKAARDGAEGYWLSPSNTELIGISGLTASVSGSLTDEAADTNLLNGQGIVTVFRKSGMGTRLWGNWTAAYIDNPQSRDEIYFMYKTKIAF